MTSVRCDRGLLLGRKGVQSVTGDRLPVIFHLKYVRWRVQGLFCPFCFSVPVCGLMACFPSHDISYFFVINQSRCFALAHR